MKMKCLECSNVFGVSRAATWKAARPYCPKCGSKAMEPYRKAPPVNLNAISDADLKQITGKKGGL